MAKVKVRTFGEGHFKFSAVVGVITLKIHGELEEGDMRTEIPEEEAKQLLSRQLDSYAGSNDGSELLANAHVEIQDRIQE